MRTIVPNLNKTTLKRVLEVTPPGSHVGFIDWKNITVKALRGEDGWKEVYIPFSLFNDSCTSLNNMESVFRSIERVWGAINTAHDGTKGLIKYKGKPCFYMCFCPAVSSADRLL